MAHAYVRPAAALIAGLLAAGVLQTFPAAAAPGDGPVASISVKVFKRSESNLGFPSGSTPEQAAPLGRAPGSADLEVRITNTGSESLHALAVSNQVLANGSVAGPTCDFTDAGSAARAADDDPVLEPGLSIVCGASLSGVLEDVLHDDVSTVTATGVDSGAATSAQTHFFATAEDESVRLCDRVWLDADRDGIQDPGEPGIAGVRLSVTGPDGDTVPDVVVPDRVVGPRTTDDQGAYTFKHLSPLAGGDRYTVTVDAGSPALEGLVPTRAGVGGSDQDSSTTTASSTAGLSQLDTDTTLDFGFVKPQAPPPAPSKASVRLTVVATPARAVKGTTITVKGGIRRAGKAYKTSTVLELRVDGGASWSKVKTVRSSSKGALTASVTASRSGSFRYRFGGNSTTAAGASALDHVVVRKASVRLSVNAPGSVTKGKKITVKGGIRREGKTYKTTTVLEFRSRSGASWKKVKTVRSSSKGALSTTVKPSRSGSYRYRFGGNSTTDPGTSRADHVTVKPKPTPKPKPKKYKNCTALVKVYPHGVGRSGAEDNAGIVTNFTRDTKTYNLNTKSDRDKDGIACER